MRRRDDYKNKNRRLKKDESKFKNLNYIFRPKYGCLRRIRWGIIQYAREFVDVQRNVFNSDL